MSGLRDFLDTMSRNAFGVTKAEAHDSMSCIRCRNVVYLIGYTDVERREYEISGVCPKCWRWLFPPKDES